MIRALAAAVLSSGPTRSTAGRVTELKLVPTALGSATAAVEATHSDAQRNVAFAVIPVIRFRSCSALIMTSQVGVLLCFVLARLARLAFPRRRHFLCQITVRRHPCTPSNAGEQRRNRSECMLSEGCRHAVARACFFR